MPYGPTAKPQKDRALTEAEREQRIQELQAKQEERLIKALGSELYYWLDSFESDADVLKLSQASQEPPG